MEEQRENGGRRVSNWIPAAAMYTNDKRGDSRGRDMSKRMEKEGRGVDEQRESGGRRNLRKRVGARRVHCRVQQAGGERRVIYKDVSSGRRTAGVTDEGRESGRRRVGDRNRGTELELAGALWMSTKRAASNVSATGTCWGRV